MAIELLTNDHYPYLEDAIINARKYIYIVSPFIGFQTAKLLCENLSEKNIKCTIITRFYREDFLNNASSIKGLDILKKQGVSIYALKGLHSKLYIFDDKIAVLGSANFTYGGFALNHELSLYISEEPTLQENLKRYFDVLLIEVLKSEKSEVSQELIDNEIVMLEKIIKGRKDKNITYTNEFKYGAEIKNGDIPRKENDILESILIESANVGKTEPCWLKFEGTGESRFDPNLSYDVTKLNRGSIFTLTNFPIFPASIKSGDYIYLAAISWDKNGDATPMIVARAATKGANKENIADGYMKDKYPWMERYPYYIELHNIEIIDTAVINCISLNSILMEVGSNTYPSTLNKNLTFAELRTRHYRKAYLRITNFAKIYIDTKFEELVKKYGLK